MVKKEESGEGNKTKKKPAAPKKRVEDWSTEKERGNKCYKNKQYAAAVECYTRSIELQPDNPAILFGNRAQAYLQMEFYAQAEADAAKAVELDPTYVKGYSRRGNARNGLGKYRAALEDFERVLELKPKDKETRKKVEKLRKLVHKGTHSVKEMQNKPRRKMIIEETEGADDDDSDDDVEVVKSTSKTTTTTVSTEPVVVETTTTPNKKVIKIKKKQGKRMVIEDDAAVTENSNVNGIDESVVTATKVDSSSQIKQNKPSRKIVIEEVDDDDENENDDEEDVPIVKKETKKTSVSSKPVNKGKKRIATKSSPKSSPKTKSGSSGSGPKTSYEFMKVYANIKDDRAALYEYVKPIGPSKYAGLFKGNLEAEVLVNLVSLFGKEYVENKETKRAIKSMVGLSAVRRFSMLVKFLNSDNRAIVDEALASLDEAVKELDAEDVEQYETVRDKFVNKK
eukprot:TRINITY_DN1498_c0_g1_i10.p1 TRINITY_DN1498_c0_g1~~TRINITY_DN1498_c0_g1_i10.p1  ORF type:complete len:453 (-),score=174.89 TRINITY_DN1498_c0_g1_i10:1340-2698(-)